MEEDAGKMVHIGGGEGRIAGATHSLIDYNRWRHAAHRTGNAARSNATPEEARLFMQELRQNLSRDRLPIARWKRDRCVAMVT